jgi:hypothetical protein
MNGAEYITSISDEGITITSVDFLRNMPVREVMAFDTWDTGILAGLIVDDRECLKRFALDRLKTIREHGSHKGEGISMSMEDE